MKNRIVARIMLAQYETPQVTAATIAYLKSAGFNSVMIMNCRGHCEPAHYTREELARIDAEIAAENVRGATPRYWADVGIGEKVTPLVRGPLGQHDMIAWRMAVGGGHIR